MSASANSNKRPKNTAIDLIAGGTAGLFEALCCHPLDTIKVRMQLFKKSIGLKSAKPPGLIKTGVNIVQNEGFFALYRGLGAVCIGIVPKMAIRFSSYEFYKSLFINKETGQVATSSNFISGVMAGVTEAVLVVNPMEVVKIRLQAQHNSLKDPLQVPKYRSAPQAALMIVREEGLKTLYRGVSLTAARQAINQGANFTTYSFLKSFLQDYQNAEVLPSYQTAVIGFTSGAIGPLCNNPLDTIKTRMQKETGHSNESNFARGVRIGANLFKESGVKAFYKGILPRVMRVASGQCVVFPVYEFFKGFLYDVSGVSGKQKLED
ncbi:hypothetical protein KL918_001999 [Ogataea parapolymorpha]|uniref:Succinate/fumarate mitochondrial transporter n=1 Tax=Ogataea parapolymorpha (strain ATCC 26012 / BCRC 20466 / JCM 22074 / NRRL Y-7560 / DL-1) TaxID=871575 RepID=W1QDI3_OGAPD|nr:Succinate/fumarate mitochondrial transporter [Ogataea parapolymorpha DL-1]ESW98609.1 Succinate/fumarate mitochondrial transporter [Ogataea parapolymorpha DL-1]KAG7868341.1 hypothetical protein KL918_001999 [Ogataea parapolymorpha]KAG7871435.1 hypothetical protein KL916_004015 [Ogataea parapolymorpha]